jgi:hypothetical protein
MIPAIKPIAAAIKATQRGGRSSGSSMPHIVADGRDGPVIQLARRPIRPRPARGRPGYNRDMQPEEQPPKPGIADALGPRKKIGEMTPDEYLKLVRDAQKALEKPRPERR